MKKSFTPIHLLFVIVFTFSYACDDSFLEENQKEYDAFILDSYLYVNPTNIFTEVTITISELKNKKFSVVQYPTIIKFQSLSGEIDASGNLIFSISVDNFESFVSLEPLELGEIVLNISDFGMLSIPVIHQNLGVTDANIDITTFDLGAQLMQMDFKLKNNENGYLWYKLVQIPTWIKIRQTYLIDDYLEINKERILGPHATDDYTIFPDRDILTPGEHEGEIVIATSDPNHPEFVLKVKITVPSYENPSSMIPIEGAVVDAKFDKTSNTLYYITQNPVKVVSYQINTGTKKELSTKRSPNSIRLTADNKTLLIGESGMIEFVDAATLTLIDMIELPYSVSEIEDGENGYYYFTNNVMEIFSYNTATNEIKKQKIIENNVIPIEADMLLKAAGKKQLIFSRKNYNPNGVYLVDYSDPENLLLVKYWHRGFGNMIFTSFDKNFIFSKENGHIYRFPDQNTSDNLYDLGKFVPDNSNWDYFYDYQWFDHNILTSSVWTSYNYRVGQRNILVEFDDKTYERRRTLVLKDYAATINGNKNYYKTLAHFLFSDNAGERLAVIKNIDEYNVTNWHLEIIDLTN